MKEATRKRKEGLMLKAALRVMQRKGLTNFTMEEVADEANVTKVTLYTYFTSKENLTMAVSYSIYEMIHQLVLGVIEKGTGLNGLETCMNVKASVLDLVAEEPFRSNMIMEIIAVYNMPTEKLSNAMANSPYRVKLNEKLPVLAQLIYDTLDKGRKDGSIGNEAPNEMLIVYLWNCLSGFITASSTPGFQHPEAQAFLRQMSVFHEKFARDLLSSK